MTDLAVKKYAKENVLLRRHLQSLLFVCQELLAEPLWVEYGRLSVNGWSKEDESLMLNAMLNARAVLASLDEEKVDNASNFVKGVSMDDRDRVELLARQIHGVYCQYCTEIRGENYWTGGNYNLLDEKTKEADRYMARFVFARDAAIREDERKKCAERATAFMDDLPIFAEKYTDDLCFAILASEEGKPNENA